MQISYSVYSLFLQSSNVLNDLFKLFLEDLLLHWIVEAMTRNPDAPVI